jgi:trimeric autotransporter adhesin
MATYDNDLRLKEITTGDEDGTWGTSTNTNLELIADSFSYGTKAIPSNANTTFTMADAASDTTRSFYLKITSAVSLTATRTVTLGPNTISKVWLIENATTGGQSIIISQGSGANVTVPNGSKVFIATDGNGVGAAVYNANPTEVGGTVTSVAGTGTVNGISLSGTVTSSGNITLGGALTGVNLTSQVTGTLPVANGGTGGTLPVANGGTGATTLTANNVILGNGTSAVQAVAPGASGNVLTSDGTTWTSGAAPSSLIGQTIGPSPQPRDSVFLGYCAGTDTTWTTPNTYTGNTAIGACSMATFSSSTSYLYCNTAVGYNAMRVIYSQTCGHTAIGADASRSGAGWFSIRIGMDAGRFSCSSRCGVAIGFRAGYSSGNYTSDNNIFIGTCVGYCVLSCNNTAIGGRSFMGPDTGNTGQFGQGNSFLGACSGRSNCSGSYNVAIGERAMYLLNTGCNNIAIGQNSGQTTVNTGSTGTGLCEITTQSNHIIMGNTAHTCALIQVGWTTVSDCRDKSCFKEVPHGLDFVNALKPTEYQFKKSRDTEETDGVTRYGFLAQDIVALEGESPIVASASDPDKLKYTEAHMVPILVKAIQELSAEVKRLKES